MRTVYLDILLNQGSDFSRIIEINGQDGPQDLTDYSFLGQIRSSTDPLGTPVAEFVFEVLNQTTDKGKVKWSLGVTAIDSIVTSIASPLVEERLTTPFLYDVKMLDSLENTTRILQGLARVSPQATQENFP